ncbi:MAG: Crp/Fnr family transcriptional regulator [Deltaproteobacteria bacterium]|nr:Crp/Fnr family transcriptional regulator [Deltaproteobacteria bacterium]
MAEEPLTQRFSKEFPRGTVLFREGEPGREMFVVQSGKVAISLGAGGREKVVALLGQGEFLGEMSLLSSRPRSATATVAEDARLLVIDPRTFDAMIRGNAEIAVRMIKKLADRLHAADDQIELLLHPDASSRVVHWLARQVERLGPGPQRVAVAPEELARQVGVAPDRIQEVLATLERARLLERGEGGLTVAEPGKLRHFLEFLQLRGSEGGTP